MLGLIIWILVGGASGYLAGQFMNTNYSFGKNVLLGIAGGIVGGLLIGLIGFSSHSIISDIIVSVAGACLIIWAARKWF